MGLTSPPEPSCAKLNVDWDGMFAAGIKFAVVCPKFKVCVGGIAIPVDVLFSTRVSGSITLLRSGSAALFKQVDCIHPQHGAACGVGGGGVGFITVATPITAPVESTN